MRFHISSHHTPNNCAVHRGDGTAPVTNWPERCKQIGVEFVAGGGFNSSHLSFMFVETDDVSKLQELMSPVIGYWDVEVTPVRAYDQAIKLISAPPCLLGICHYCIGQRTNREVPPKNFTSNIITPLIIVRYTGVPAERKIQSQTSPVAERKPPLPISRGS